MDLELKEMLEKLNTASTELKNMRATYDKQLKAATDGNEEAKEAIGELKASLDAQAEKHQTAMDDLLAQMKRPGGNAQEAKTIGQQFVSSDVYSEVKTTGRGNGQPFEAKQITGATGSAIALVDADRDPNVYRSIGGRRQLRIADIIPSVPTSSGAVEIMRFASVTNNAAPQGTAAGQGAGEFIAKAQSNLTWELVTVPVRTVAHFIPASRQALADAPMLQGIIDTELSYGLQLQSDFQLLNGDGTGQNLTGILNDTAINNVGQLASGTAADDVPAAMIDHIRAAITLCQQFEYYNMTGLVLNPADWQILETAKATDGHYLLVAHAPTAGENPSVWRVPVIVSNAMPADNFLVGDWTMAATIYRREGVTVRVSESHADYFVKNGVAILGEERYCLAINRPKAMTKGLFTVAL